MNETSYDYTRKAVIWCIVGLIALMVLSFVFAGGCRSYHRYQKRADAKNAITVTHTKIGVAQQQAKINRAQIAATKAEAEKRYQESIGIRRAQDEISKTLTPLYVQHEAIQAQKAAADSPNHTQVYIPSGNQGVPLVKPTP
jgi:uncharacterized iron-regulated membrane protein